MTLPNCIARHLKRKKEANNNKTLSFWDERVVNGSIACHAKLLLLVPLEFNSIYFHA